MIKQISMIILTLSIIFLSICEEILWVIKSDDYISPYFLNLIIFIISILLFISIINRIKNKSKYNKIIINKENDKIFITENAIKQLIKNIIVKNTNIINVQTDVFVNKEKEVIIEIKSNLKIGSNIVEITEFIRSEIKKTYKNLIGNNLADIKIIITGFVNINNQ